MIPFAGWDPGAWAGARQRRPQRQHPEACQLSRKQPSQTPVFSASAEHDVEMSDPAGQGLGEAGAEAIPSGWEEVGPAGHCPELRGQLFVWFP